MSVTAAFTDQLKQDLFNGVHQPGDTYKVALYTQAAATMDKTTTAYSSTGEVTGAGYSAGGASLSGFTVGISSDTAYMTFSNATWASSTITADAALIYNSSRSNKAMAVLTFSSTTSSNGTFTLQFPAAGASAVITMA